MDRLEHLKRFYWALEKLEQNIGGARKLADCSGHLDWPSRGVYFFREHGEDRSDTGTRLRIVRIGTHGLTTGSKTKLWKRLSQHKGSLSARGGNHRGSIFRLIIGAALIKRHGYKNYVDWGVGNSANSRIYATECSLEREVSQIIGNMSFVWLAIEDAAGPGSARGYIERNAIALLSNYNKTPIDSPSRNWLGHDSDREKVRNAGLWNQRHVDENYDPGFLDELERLVAATK